MGNIKSFCCQDNVSTADDQDERARILGDNCVSTNSLDNNSLNSDRDDISYGSMRNQGSSSGKTMEQSALDKIYQKMAANVIDVAPGESMVIQPAEFIERQRAYQAKLNQIKTPLPLRSLNAKVNRNANSSTLDATVISSNATRINTSISTAGANLTVFNQLNSSANTMNNLTSASANNHSHGHLANNSNSTNTTTTTKGDSPQHLNRVQEKRRVEYEPISVEEIQLINEISDRTVNAIKGLRIISNEPVVTSFQP
uniref:Ragulator complex protein LAMTOR1 n=1 Tax=Aceria tosichella TaxID=561515 RepID=A0A6G1SFR6_9ACAR